MALPTSGLTLHLDAKATTHLFTTYSSSGVHTGTPVDGGTVQVWDDEGDGIADVIAVYPNTSNQAPNLRSSTPLMRRSCLDFDGSLDTFETYNQTGTSAKSLTNFISASAATLIVAFYAEAITNTSATASSNELLVGNNRFALVTRDVSGVKKLRGLNYDGNEDSLEVTITTGATYLGILKHESGFIKLSVIDSTGTETAASDVASGNTSILTESVRVGRLTGAFFNGRIGEFALWNVALSGSDLADAKAYFKEQWFGFVTSTPAVGAISVSGVAPTPVIGGLFTYAPGAGSVVASGFAPTVIGGTTLAPAVGSVVIGGVAPTLTLAGMASAPPTGAIVATGRVPTLQYSGEVRLPGTGSVVLGGGLAPSLRYSGVLPPTGLVSVGGFAPSLAYVPVLPPLVASTGNAIFQSTEENILRNAAWSGTTPDVSYSLTVFGRLDPSARVLYTTGSGTVTATIPSSRGDVLIVPVTNADALTVTNGAGMSELVPIPTMTRNRIPRTIVCDLSLLEPNVALRTSTVWHFAFTCSTANLVLGAAIALYAPRRNLLAGDFQWGGSESRRSYGTSRENEYGSKYRLTDQTMQRSVKLSKLATQADLAAFQEWFDRSWGAYGPTLLWPDPSVNDAYLGTLQDSLEVVRLAPTSSGTIFSIGIEFVELSKGRPV